MDRTWNIYELRDPRTEKVRYIGWAFNVAKRVRDHIYKARSETTHKANWLNQLAAAGLRPTVTIVESGCGSWADAERKWIALHKADGADLVNATSGGEGIVGHIFGPASRAKMSAAKKGRCQTAEHIERAHAPLRGRPRPAHVIAALVASRIGRPRSEETKAKLRVLCRGWHHSEETRTAMSIAHTGQPLSAETRAKISAAKRARDQLRRL